MTPTHEDLTSAVIIILNTSASMIGNELAKTPDKALVKRWSQAHQDGRAAVRAAPDLIKCLREIVDMPENINRADTRIVQARELLDCLEGKIK